MWTHRLKCICVGVSQMGMGGAGGERQTCSQNTTPVLTQTKFVSFRLHLRFEAHWGLRSGLCIPSVLCIDDKWVRSDYLLVESEPVQTKRDTQKDSQILLLGFYFSNVTHLKQNKWLCCYKATWIIVIGWGLIMLADLWCGPVVKLPIMHCKKIFQHF